jgi:FtsP/CotA-like multicopper oxidase with cupredoxin domain
MQFNRGDKVELAFDPNLRNGMARLRGMDDDGPATQQDSARPSKRATQMVLRQAGTFLCDLGLFPNDQGWPTRAHPLIVRESEPVAVDQDETLLIEEWRVRADGTAIPPGAPPDETMAFYTLNGKPSLDVSARSNERLRLRFINGSQRTIIAVKLESVEVRVMAIDSQPAEPFPARNGALVLAPGSRVDALVDVTAPPGSNLKIHLHEGKEIRTIGFVIVSRDPPARPAPLPPASPLPSNGLPDRIELKGATRVDLALGGPQGDWVTPVKFNATAPPAFRVKTGRTVVLALTNRAAIATVFHLHGHHFRLLDRLDDGWKPYWLDTLAIEPGQTQRIAFLAEYPGRYLLESVATDWAAPRLVRWYAVA